MDRDQLLLEQAYDDINMAQWLQGTKVVDEQGNPLKVYHGTQQGKFTQFRLPEQEVDSPYQEGGYFYDTSKNLPNNLGIWFSESREVAARFAGIPSESRAVFICYLSIKNPLMVPDYRTLIATVEQASSTLDHRALLIKQGYDGVIIEKADTDMPVVRRDFIVFSPSQIKVLPDQFDFEGK